MPDYALEISGIIVSVVLFLVGYRQTVGAKRERIRSAIGEIEKILVRRIALEDYTPSLKDLSRIIDGKSRDFGVRPPDLLSEKQFLANIFTRVVESDFIPSEQREQLLSRLQPLLAEAEVQPIVEEEFALSKSMERTRRSNSLVVVTLGLGASIFGALLAAFPVLSEIDVPANELLATLATTLAASSAVIAMLALLLRYRQQEAPSNTSFISDYAHFERKVFGAFAKAGINIKSPERRDQDYDFTSEFEGKKYLFEIKAWDDSVSINLLRRWVASLNESVKQESAAGAYLITRGKLSRDNVPQDLEFVEVLSFRELQNFLLRFRDGKA